MGVFKDGKDVSAVTELSNIDEAVLAIMDRAGDALMEKIAKTLDRLPAQRNDYQREHCKDDKDDEEGETMKALARVASSNVQVEGSNFLTLGTNEAVVAGTNIEDAIGSLGEIE